MFIGNPYQLPAALVTGTINFQLHNASLLTTKVETSAVPLHVCAERVSFSEILQYEREFWAAYWARDGFMAKMTFTIGYLGGVTALKRLVRDKKNELFYPDLYDKVEHSSFFQIIHQEIQNILIDQARAGQITAALKSAEAIDSAYWRDQTVSAIKASSKARLAE